MYEHGVGPSSPVGDETLVFDAKYNRQVLWLEGRLVLPIGSEIELRDPETDFQATATVTKVRVLNSRIPLPTL